MSKELIPLDDQTPFLLYGDGNDGVRLRVLMRQETIWLTINQMAELFDVNKSGISRHLKNIFETNELPEKATVAKIATVQAEGERSIHRDLEYYSLDAIISVGYRVNSKRATQFRIWATQVLKEFIKKGFVLDDDRLKQGEQVFGQDYFQELLNRVRSIRASERRIYQKITDIFAECSIDYDPKADITQSFYAMVQNKFHFAITGHKAAEIIHEKVDCNAPHMGLLTWKNAPNGRILSTDVTVAKNYLEEKEIKRLERTITGFFDYIENVIENRLQLTMQDMAGSVDKFLTFNEYKILNGKGRMTKARADEKALTEYKEFNKNQKIESDFDKSLKQLEKKITFEKMKKKAGTE
jgi:hypothetical protein